MNTQCHLYPTEVSDKRKSIRHDYRINNAGEDALVLFRQALDLSLAHARKRKRECMK